MSRALHDYAAGVCAAELFKIENNARTLRLLSSLTCNRLTCNIEDTCACQSCLCWAWCRGGTSHLCTDARCSKQRGQRPLPRPFSRCVASHAHFLRTLRSRAITELHVIRKIAHTIVHTCSCGKSSQSGISVASSRVYLLGLLNGPRQRLFSRTPLRSAMIVLFMIVAAIAVAVAVVVFAFRERLPLQASRAPGSNGQLQARPLLPVHAPSVSPAKQQIQRLASREGLPSIRSAGSRHSTSSAANCPGRTSAPSSATSAKAASQSLSLPSSSSARATIARSHSSAEAVSSPSPSSAHVPASESGLQHVSPDSLVPHPPLPRIRTR